MQRLRSFGDGVSPYRRLDTKDALSPPPTPPPPAPFLNSPVFQPLLGRFSRLRVRLYTVYSIIIATLILVHIVRLNPGIAASLWQTSSRNRPADLHIIIPATEPSLKLCQTLLTGAILGYPAPTLVSWGRNFTDPNLVNGGADLARLVGIRGWMDRMKLDQRNSLALVLGDDDAWFQLPPSVMIQRFHEVLRSSNRMTKARMERAYTEERIADTVVFAATKQCAPNMEDDIGCYPAPTSPLSPELYGPNTDTPRGHTEYSSFRPRYLSSSVLMGPMDDIRQITVRALNQKNEQQHGAKGSAQFIYNNMFGQQEFQRQVFRDRHLSWKGRIRHFFNAHFGHVEPSILDPHPTRQQMEHFRRRAFDFGMAIDYHSLWTHDAVDSNRDIRFMRDSDETLVVDTDRFDCEPHPKPLPRDIVGTYITSPRIRQEALVGKSWRDMPLYTNMCTGNVPAIIHTAASGEYRRRLWEQFWMAPMARELFSSFRRQVFFEAREDGAGEAGLNMGGAVTDSGKRLSWETLCSAYEHELFVA